MTQNFNTKQVLFERGTPLAFYLKHAVPKYSQRHLQAAGRRRVRLIKAAKGVFQHAHAFAYIVITEVERAFATFAYIDISLSLSLGLTLFDVLRREKVGVFTSKTGKVGTAELENFCT